MAIGAAVIVATVVIYDVGLGMILRTLLAIDRTFPGWTAHPPSFGATIA